MDYKNYQYFIKEFKQSSQIDLSQYKEDQMIRRLENFYKSNGFKDFVELANALKGNKELLNNLKSYITINVTEFFRNQKMWDVFYETAIPELIKNKKKIKIWSAACSSGEEPYTIAMILEEKFPTINVEIIATDIDDQILEKAKEGTYRKENLKSFDSKLLKKYFAEVDANHLKINDSIKRKIKFQKHDLLLSPYPADMDIIVCRNVLIYFKEEAKDQIYNKFAKSLNNKGILFIGATEQIVKPENFNFKILKSFFYQKQ